MKHPIRRGLVDLSSLLWTALKAGVDHENGTKVPYQKKDGTMGTKVINSAGWGYENFVNHLVHAMEDCKLVPSDLIFVVEGRNSKAERLAIYPKYKTGRDKLPGEYEEFEKAKAMVMEVFGNLGTTMFWQDGGVEGDDVLGYLATNLDGIVYVISNDKDMAVLVGGSPGAVVGNIHHWRDGAMDENPFGDFPFRLITTYIALVGDQGDKIPGAYLFGEGAMNDLRAIWGNAGLEAMEDLIKTRQLHRLVEDLPKLKALQKILDDQQGVYISYELARLRIEKVNTLRRPLSYRAGINKPVACPDERLRQYAQKRWLVHAGNYAGALQKLRDTVATSPEFAFDIETSTPPESDEWIESLGKDENRTPVDVMGSELTGFSITFGRNREFTYYVTVGHKETDQHKNITVEQAAALVDVIPREKVTWVHNAQFELPVCYNTWGEKWADDPLWHGFLRNVRDTLIAASYVNENESKGLKDLSSTVLNYQQTTYQETVSRTYKATEWNGLGKVKMRWCEGEERNEEGEIIEQGIPMLTVEHKMNELTAQEVFAYGCDDTICTAALAVIFRIVMEIEKTYSIYEKVETLPAYVTAKGFVDGVDFSLQGMAEQEKDDNIAYDKAWPVLREFLMKMGFEGTICPKFVPDSEIKALRDQAAIADGLSPEQAESMEWTPPTHVLTLDNSGIKRAFEIVTGVKLECRAKRLDKIAGWLDLESYTADGDTATFYALFAELVRNKDLDSLNKIIAEHYDGEPKLNLGSPKQMASLLYDFMKLPINFVNDVTVKERANDRPLADALYKHRKWRMGDGSLTDDDLRLIRKKAKSDEDAILYALAFDGDHVDDEARAALKALGVMKKVLTRRNLFYKNYWPVRHWKTGKVHPNFKQVGAATRRYSCSNPNFQQLPKKGEAVRFREHFKPHHKRAVICSIDFSGQELRLAAWRSQDPNMLSCYVGDNLRDLHSITASKAMRLKWGNAKVDELIAEYGQGIPHGMLKEEFEYRFFVHIHKGLAKTLGKDHPVPKMADDLRKDSKNVNFAAQFGGQAAKLSQTLIMPIADAQLFLDARSAMFTKVDAAAKRSAKDCLSRGYSLTMMGARRHLRTGIMSEDRKESARAARQSWNYEIQGSAGEMTKLAMSRLWESGALFKYDVRFIAPIHDELVTSIAEEDVVDFIRVKHWCMTQKYADMDVPVLGSISIGPDFGHQYECGDWFIEDNIKQALHEIFHKEPEHA